MALCITMPCSCSTAATLWKIDLTDGSVVWTADRGANSNALVVVDEAGTTYIYECGNYIDATEKSLTKWKDNGTSVTKEWTTTKGTENAADVMQATDGTIWMWGSTNIVRFNTSGTEQHSVSAPFSNGWLTSAGSARMAAWSPAQQNSSTTYHIYDNTATSVASHTVGDGTGANEAMVPMGDRVNGAATGWVWDDDGAVGTASDLVTLSTTFSETDRNTAEGTPFSANDTYVAIKPVPAATTFDVHDYTSGLPQAYSISDINSVINQHDLVGAWDGTDNLYLAIRLDSTSEEFIRKWNTSGTQQWSKELETTGSQSVTLTHDSANSQLIVVSRVTDKVDIGVDSDFVYALDDSDGSTSWSMSSDIVRIPTRKNQMIFGGHLYVCGSRFVPPA